MKLTLEDLLSIMGTYGWRLCASEPGQTNLVFEKDDFRWAFIIGHIDVHNVIECMIRHQEHLG